MELFDLTRALVNIESTTGHEQPCAEYVRAYLTERRFQVEMQEVTHGRANVLAFCGAPEVVLSSHLDTVPPHYPAEEDDEFIYGRGSCDTKGSMACQLVAAERLRAEGITNFGLLFVVGEETLSDGARFANQYPRGAKFLINGEPTENKLILASKGILNVNVRTRGRMAHSAYPELGDSAIDKLLAVLHDLQRMELPCDPLLGKATMNIGTISGGRAANIVPDEAEAKIAFRTVSPQSDLHQRVAAVLDGRCEYEIVRNVPAQMMETLPGYETGIVAYTTDVPNLSNWGRPYLLGPGSIADAHTDHERVGKADLRRAVDLYCRLVRDLKARG